MIALLFNIASLCFFGATACSLYRNWKAKKKMDSTSLSGLFLHLLGNIVSTIASFAVAAYIACIIELILSVVIIVRLYLKLRWIKKWKT